MAILGDRVSQGLPKLCMERVLTDKATINLRWGSLGPTSLEVVSMVTQTRGLVFLTGINSK